MVSTHPNCGGGVSSYTKNLVQSLRELGVDITVFSNKPENGRQKQSDEGVCAIWNRGSIRYPFQIFKMLASNASVDVVHVQHEFFLCGGMFSAIIFPVLLVLTRLLVKPVIVTIHGVIPLSELNERFKEENELNGPLLLLKFGLIILTKAIVFLSDAVIVHEGFFAERLEKDYRCPQRKIYVISHGVEEIENKILQDEAKDKLGLNNKTVILFFGYITKYKGIETLIDSFGYVARQREDLVLIIGGGEHPRHRNNSHYCDYLLELRHRASSMAPPQKILFTGFIPNEELPLYFSAADLVIFPYTTSISSSGPLSLAASYGKTVIASDTPSFAEIIPFEQALFTRNSSESLANKIEQMLNSSFLRRRVSSYIDMMAKEDSWHNVGSKTCALYRRLLRAQDLMLVPAPSKDSQEHIQRQARTQRAPKLRYSRTLYYAHVGKVIITASRESHGV